MMLWVRVVEQLVLFLTNISCNKQLARVNSTVVWNTKTQNIRTKVTHFLNIRENVYISCQFDQLDLRFTNKQCNSFEKVFIIESLYVVHGFIKVPLSKPKHSSYSIVRSCFSADENCAAPSLPNTIVPPNIPLHVRSFACIHIVHNVQSIWSGLLFKLSFPKLSHTTKMESRKNVWRTWKTLVNFRLCEWMYISGQPCI